MFIRLSRGITRHPIIMIVAWAIIAVASFCFATLGVSGQTLFDRANFGISTPESAESVQAQKTIEAAQESGKSLTLIVDGIDFSDDRQVGRINAALGPVRAKLRQVDGVADVIDPLALPRGVENPSAAPIVASDKHGFLLTVHLEPQLDPGKETDALDNAAAILEWGAANIQKLAPGATGIVGGQNLVIDEVRTQSEHDLLKGELIALPIALVIMILVFAGFLAAAVPVAGALAAITSSLGALFLLSHVANIETTVVNVALVLAIGLSIDYGLLMVSRYRAELRASLAGLPEHSRRRRRAGEDAMDRTMRTAGRTVLLSGLIIAICVASLLTFTPTLLRGFGFGGLVVVVLAILTGLTLVPAIMTLLSERLIQPSLLDRIPGFARVGRLITDEPTDTGVFSRIATFATRRPIPVLVGVLAILAICSIPVFHTQYHGDDSSILPVSGEQKAFVDTLATKYPQAAVPDLTVVSKSSESQTRSLAERIKKIGGVTEAEVVPQSGYVAIYVHTDFDNVYAPPMRQLVHQIRDLDGVAKFQVTGEAALLEDFVDALKPGMLSSGLVIAIAVLLLLYLATKSVILPLKALLLAAVSLLASLGIMTWIFQDGHFEGLLGFTTPGGLQPYVVILLLVVGFGLSMDYEVFLLSRIKEAHDAGEDNVASVVLGLQRSGRIITSAALIMVLIFLGFITGELLVVKEIGLGLAVAIFVDATLVRMLLVPAVMRLLGRWNWWRPAFLVRFDEPVALWSAMRRRPAAGSDGTQKQILPSAADAGNGSAF